MPSLENYASHKFEWLTQSVPGEPTEHFHVCTECGMEDRGSPLEFPELKYPHCEEMED